MDSYHEAHLMRILERRRRRGVLGVFDNLPGHGSHEHTQTGRARAGSVTAATQTAAPLAEASTSPLPHSRGVQTLRRAADVKPSSSPTTNTHHRSYGNGDNEKNTLSDRWHEDSGLDNPNISSVLADAVSGARARSTSWRRDRPRQDSWRDPNYSPTHPEYAAVRYRSPSCIPSLRYSPRRSHGRRGSSPAASPLFMGNASSSSLPRPLSPPRYRPSRFEEREQWRPRGRSSLSEGWRGCEPSRFVPALARRQSAVRSGGLVFASPLRQRSQRPSWLAAGTSGSHAQPLARWNSPSSLPRSHFLDDWQRLPQNGTIAGTHPGEREGSFAGGEDHHHHHHHHHDREEKARKRGHSSKGRAKNRPLSSASAQKRRGNRRKEGGRSRSRSKGRKGKTEKGRHLLDPSLSLTPLDRTEAGPFYGRRGSHRRGSDDGTDSQSSRSSSSSSSSSSSPSASSSSSSRADRAGRERRGKVKKRNGEGKLNKSQTTNKKLAAMPFPKTSGTDGRRGGTYLAGSVVPLEATTRGGGGGGGFLQQSGTSGRASATRTNLSLSQPHVNPNDQVGIPDVRSTFDLKTSAEALQAGDWFYKWNRRGTEVHARWIWVDLRSYLLVWSHRETRDPTFSGSIKLENITQIMPSELIQADEEGLPKTFYVLMISATTRVLQLASERRNKVDTWFEALSNVVAFVRRRDIAKGTQVPD